jgi:hypothetical protein
VQRSRRSRWSFDEGNGLEKIFPRRKEQEGCHGGQCVEELTPRAVFLARAPEFVRDLAGCMHSEGEQIERHEDGGKIFLAVTEIVLKVISFWS